MTEVYKGKETAHVFLILKESSTVKKLEFGPKKYDKRLIQSYGGKSGLRKQILAGKLPDINMVGHVACKSGRVGNAKFVGTTKKKISAIEKYARSKHGKKKYGGMFNCITFSKEILAWLNL